MRFASSAVQAAYASPLGPIILAADHERLLGVWFEGQSHQPDTSRWPSGDCAVLDQALTQLTEYFAGERQVFDLPLDLSGGTNFQQTVWRALLQIPSGASMSYGALSARIGQPTAVRAVAGAVARNPLSIIVPCHRVLGAGASLTGYAGGLPRKTALLQLEGASFKPEPTPVPVAKGPLGRVQPRTPV